MFYELDGSETLLYDNLGVEYGTGVFTITIDPPVTANAIIVRRAGMITLCEVEILGGKKVQCFTSGKHVREMCTPSNPTFIWQNWGTQGYTYEAVLASTHNLRFGAKIRKISKIFQ